MNQTVKIFVDCHVFDGKRQGTTTYLKGLYSTLIKNNEIIFYLASFDIENLTNEFGQQKNIVYLKYRSKNKFYRLLIDIPFLIRKHKIDYAHFQYVVPPVKFCKYIVTIHDVLFLDHPEYFPFLYQLKNKMLFYQSAKNADFVLTVSEYSKKNIQNHFKINNILITPNAVDPSYYENYNKNEVRNYVKKNFKINNYFLYVSRREPRKNHLNLIKAFVENHHFVNHDLVFVGVNDLPDKLFDVYYQALPDNIKKSIFFLENIDFKDIIAITKGAKIAIYPSFAEGFGIPPLESIAANIPTICSNTTAMTDFNFMPDFLFSPHSISQINDKINLALNTDSVENIRSLIKEKYDWKISSKVLMNILFSVK